MRAKHPLVVIVTLILIAASLRCYRLGTSPLRGDEAFTIRYWAAPPAEILSGLAWIEPHPFGAFFSFGLWRALFGDSEIAMRLLPALLNLIGVPVMFSLGRRMFRDDHVGYAASLFWALNPYQIWHSQDVRNYAIWSALSALTMWLLIRAADKRRRIDWLLYVIAEAAALYSFFFQAFFLLIGLYYVCQRKAWRAWLISMCALAVLLIPWFGQAWALAHSGYKGTAGSANPLELLTRFLPSLIFGETNPLFEKLWQLAAMFFTLGLFFLWRRSRQNTARFLIIYLCLPALLLTLAATRMNVFLPRYLIAATPALLLTLAYGLVSLYRFIGYAQPRIARSGAAILGVLCIVLPLFNYWHSGYRKTGTDWFGLRDYLATHVRPDDLILLTTLDPNTGNVDPSFTYYYRGKADAYSLPRPGIDTADYIRQAAENYRAIWFIPSGDYARPIDLTLRENTQLISDQGAGENLIVRQYRSHNLKLNEIDHPLSLHTDDLTLNGYSIEQSHSQLTLILFWQPGFQTTDKIFVHLIGAPNPANGSPLWSQDDHLPLSPARDIYTLNLTDVPPGAYSLNIGLYDPTNPAQRRIWFNQSAEPIGENITLAPISR